MKPLFSLTAIVALATAGCVDRVVESRVNSALVDAGVSSKNARCMARRMVDRLTIAQLRKLEEVKAKKGESEKPVSLGQYVERVRRVGDPEVIGVTASSAAMCAAGIG